VNVTRFSSSGAAFSGGGACCVSSFRFVTIHLIYPTLIDSLGQAALSLPPRLQEFTRYESSDLESARVCSSSLQSIPSTLCISVLL
jgi:hypothetical protein